MKELPKFTLIFAFFILLMGCFRSLYYEKSYSFSLSAKNKNVCKELKDSCIVYCIFVDDKNAVYWSDKELEDSKRAITKSISWINEQASKNLDGSLNIKLIFHKPKGKEYTVQKNLKYGSINSHLFEKRKRGEKGGIAELEKWADGIASNVLLDLKNKNSNFKKRLGLVQLLKDRHGSDNVAILYVLNNPIRDDSSVSLWTDYAYNNDKPEYAVISESKRSPVIAHEILHLFGASDFYTIYYNGTQKYGNVGYNNNSDILREYPNSIMKNPNSNENIDSLYIDPVTQFLIGWKNENELTTKEKELLLYGREIKLSY